MTAEQLFSILNLITAAAWLLLVFLPRVRWAATVVPVVMPALLAGLYVVLVAATLGRSEGGFSSLAGVRALFDNPWTLLAGWTHYMRLSWWTTLAGLSDASWLAAVSDSDSSVPHTQSA